MTPLVQLKRPTAVMLVTIACFRLTSLVQAVNPAPDGGYPGGNTAEGTDALSSLPSNGGTGNTAIGFKALYNNTTGINNTGVGYGALVSNLTGRGNTATGFGALFNNGVSGTNERDQASFNSAFGTAALATNTTGGHNSAFGMGALALNTSAPDNTAVGWFALLYNNTGYRNTAVGSAALFENMDGSDNVAVGVSALQGNTNGYYNTAIGSRALQSNEFADFNTAIGYLALNQNVSGDNNVAVGFGALGDNTHGHDNVALGHSAGISVLGAHNNICIGAFVSGYDMNDTCFIGNIWNNVGGTQAVYVNSDGRLGYSTSSRRFKDEITPMEQVSEIIYGLKPVSFRYKPEFEPTRPRGFGLIAEEVEKISPDLVTRDSKGQVNSVRYEAVNAMLLNEFLKEHRKNEEQGATITALRANDAKQEATIARLEQTVAALDEALQKVSAQLEVSKAKPQTVLNNQ